MSYSLREQRVPVGLPLPNNPGKHRLEDEVVATWFEMGQIRGCFTVRTETASTLSLMGTRTDVLRVQQSKQRRSRHCRNKKSRSILSFVPRLRKRASDKKTVLSSAAMAALQLVGDRRVPRAKNNKNPAKKWMSHRSPVGHKTKKSSQNQQHSAMPSSPLWRSAEDPNTGRTYYYHVETRETQWRKPLELATPEERREAEEKEKKQRDFFAAMESNILKSISAGAFTQEPTEDEDKDDQEEFSEEEGPKDIAFLPQKAALGVKPVAETATARQRKTQRKPPCTFPKVHRPNLVRTISSMEDSLLVDLIQRVPSHRGIVGSNSKEIVFQPRETERDYGTPLTNRRQNSFFNRQDSERAPSSRSVTKDTSLNLLEAAMASQSGSGICDDDESLMGTSYASSYTHGLSLMDHSSTMGLSARSSMNSTIYEKAQASPGTLLRGLSLNSSSHQSDEDESKNWDGDSMMHPEVKQTANFSKESSFRKLLQRLPKESEDSVRSLYGSSHLDQSSVNCGLSQAEVLALEELAKVTDEMSQVLDSEDDFPDGLTLDTSQAGISEFSSHAGSTCLANIAEDGDEDITETSGGDETDHATAASSAAVMGETGPDEAWRSDALFVPKPSPIAKHSPVVMHSPRGSSWVDRAEQGGDTKATSYTMTLSDGATREFSEISLGGPRSAGQVGSVQQSPTSKGGFRPPQPLFAQSVSSVAVEKSSFKLPDQASGQPTRHIVRRQDSGDTTFATSADKLPKMNAVKEEKSTFCLPVKDLAKPQRSSSTRSIDAVVDERKASMKRRNTCGTLYVGSTMSTPDVDATIKCVAGVFRAHILQSEQEDAADDNPDYRIFNDLESHQKQKPAKKDQYRPHVDFVVKPPPPTLDQVSTFYRDVFHRAKMEADCVIMSLIYVERLVKVTNGQLRPRTSCMILASKVWDDLSMWNADFSQTCPAGVRFSLQRINELEIAILNVLSYKVKVRASEYAKYYFLLRSMLIKSGLGGKDLKASNPLDVEGAKKLQHVSTVYQSAMNQAKGDLPKAAMLRSKSAGFVLATGKKQNADGTRAKLEHVVQM